MSALAVNESLDFISLREYLQVTDGNLATHLKALEREDFISITKSFVGKKPNTRYAMTKAGKKAFDEHLKTLENLIQSQKKRS